MDSILKNDIFRYRAKYFKQKSDKLHKFRPFIDIDFYLKLKNDLNFKISIYNDMYFSLRPFFFEKNNNLLYNDFSILKTKLFSFETIGNFYILIKYLKINISENDNILLVSHNYCIVELFKFYNYNNIDHFYYNARISKYNEIIENNIKSTYKFNNYIYGTELKKKYKFMLFDIVMSRIYIEDIINNNSIQFKKIIKDKEHSNIILLKHLYDYLDNLENNGNILILISLYFTEETLLYLENIINCFKYIKLYKFGNDIGFFPFIYCYKFKGKQKKQTKLSINFYNYVKKIYESIIKIGVTHVEFNKKINNLITENPNSTELQELYNRNYNICEQIAKYIGIETYNYRDNLYYELSNYMQQFYILDQTINIKFNINQTLININDIIMISNNNIHNDIHLINNRYLHLIKQQLYRPKTLLLNIESQIINNYSTINDILNTNNKNKKIKITDQWILIYELFNIINFDKLKHNLIINLLLISNDNVLIGPLAYYIKKNLTNHKLNHKIIKLIQPKSDIKSTTNDYDWIIIDDNLQNINMIYANILYMLSNLNYGYNSIIRLDLPIIDKIIIDLIYILYLSFNNLLFVKPIYKQSSTVFYIVCLSYNKLIIDFTSLIKIKDTPDINQLSIISDDYIHDFKFQFINVYNILMKNQTNIIDTKLFFTDFWQNISDNIKSEIKSAINTKNINYIEKYFNNFS